jgi:hypothetical protein
MAAMCCSSVNRGEFGSAPNSLRHQAAMDSVEIGMERLRFFLVFEKRFVHWESSMAA